MPEDLYSDGDEGGSKDCCEISKSVLKGKNASVGDTITLKVTGESGDKLQVECVDCSTSNESKSEEHQEPQEGGEGGGGGMQSLLED